MGEVIEGWYPDPSGEHDLRWWDGSRWTARTASRNDLTPSASPRTDASPADGTAPTATRGEAPAGPIAPPAPATPASPFPPLPVAPPPPRRRGRRKRRAPAIIVWTLAVLLALSALLLARVSDETETALRGIHERISVMQDEIQELR